MDKSDSDQKDLEIVSYSNHGAAEPTSDINNDPSKFSAEAKSISKTQTILLIFGISLSGFLHLLDTAILVTVCGNIPIAPRSQSGPTRHCS